MNEYAAFALVMVALALFVAVIAKVAGNAAIKRFMSRTFERGAMVILDRETNPRALYFVATLQGTDVARVKAALVRSRRRPFVWMTQGGRGAAPGRSLLLDAVTEVSSEHEWTGELTPDFESEIRKRLEVSGVTLSALRVAADVPFDDAARARHAWWVCYTDYELVAGTLCCDALEFWLDARGAELWSLSTRDKKVAADPAFAVLSSRSRVPPPPAGRAAERTNTTAPRRNDDTAKLT